MELFRRLNYIVEILLAEMVFLSVCPRRKRFPLRLAVTAAVSMVLGYWCSLMQGTNAPLEFVVRTALLGVTIFGMYTCFEGSFLSILSICTAGVALQHIGHHLSCLLVLLPFLGGWNPIYEAVMCLLLCVPAFLAVRGKRYYEHYDPRLTAVSVIVVLLCTGLTRFLRLGGAYNMYAVICTSLYAITCCAFALFIQFFLYRFISFQSEYLILRRISEEERRQYELSRENTELLNVKCHDLKHKLVALEERLPRQELDSMRSIIDSYDGTYHTGLDVLDIILNEKSLRCRSRGIALTYMGCGGELAFMDAMDVYSLFGNILENAIDAAEALEQPEKKTISLVIERKGDFLFINMLNYMGGAELSFEDGLPGTTKTAEVGYHGFGLKSVRAIAKKYDGDVTVSAGDGMFRLSVHLMREGERRSA